ncbi:hypothetical protein T492DRAFT_912821 [Pavlovales sp. CCMP2436]|nr:hypothetical protein T492DRAFT_912821 [Pavlovales sp. CCMP2436]|mmetsp:Transcript_17964/g.46035  ORF Transcript_17964/g.46035 Transcript_17964/m.46035 type:complete len:283 (+) Transcript_17964:149-997(+)
MSEQQFITAANSPTLDNSGARWYAGAGLMIPEGALEAGVSKETSRRLPGLKRCRCAERPPAAQLLVGVAVCAGLLLAALMLAKGQSGSVGFGGGSADGTRGSRGVLRGQAEDLARYATREVDACSSVLTKQVKECGTGSDTCVNGTQPASFEKPCPDDKLQDAFRIDDTGSCVQICLPPGLRKVGASHGVQYGMNCYTETPRNLCTRWEATGSRAGVKYYIFYCLSPCSNAEQSCTGPTLGEYDGNATRGPARPRWDGDWWPGIDEDELETQAALCKKQRGH